MTLDTEGRIGDHPTESVIKDSVITPVALGRPKLYRTVRRNDWRYRKNMEMKFQREAYGLFLLVFFFTNVDVVYHKCH